MQIHEDIRFQKMIEQMEALYLENCVDKMQELLEQLQTLAETEQDAIGLACAYFYRDILSSQKPNGEIDMQYAIRSLIISQAQNVPYYEMKASNSLGIMYSELSDFHTSLEHYLRAIHIAETHPEFCYAAVVLNNVGNLFVWLEDYAEAVTYLERAYEKSITENQNDRQLIALIVLNLIELFSNMENYEKVHEWEGKNIDLLEPDEKEIIACIKLINEARQYAHDERRCEIKEKLLTFINYPVDSANYIYAFRCCINALKLGIALQDFELSAKLAAKLKIMQKDSTISSFSYDYALIRMEYFRAFSSQIAEKAQEFYDDYFRESQSRIVQLRNTYAKSLAVKIAYEDMKDENVNVHMQNELLQKDVEKDVFTNLYNKISTEKYVRKALERQSEDKVQGLMVIDIDLFKRVNDNYGHGIGDKVIIRVAEIIESLDCESKIAGRFGGDEFFLFLDRQDNVEVIKSHAEYLLNHVASDIELPDDRIKTITLSMGICVINRQMSFEEAFALADEALYQAKELGRNRYVVRVEE